MAEFTGEAAVDTALDRLLDLANGHVQQTSEEMGEGALQSAQAVRDAVLALREEVGAALAAQRTEATETMNELRDQVQNLRAEVVAFRRLVIEQRNELTRAIGEVEGRTAARDG